MKPKLLSTVLALCAGLLGAVEALGVTNVFFNSSQTATLVTSNINTVTIRSGDYFFSYSVDGYWSPSPGGPPTGRFFTVFWPNGVQAQAITAGPGVGAGANITLKRVDGRLFDLSSFTGKILANTAGAGAAFEIMPLLRGEDGLPEPIMFDATGYAGQSFTHTPGLSGYDAYKIHLWVDYAVTALALNDTNAVTPTGATNTIAALVSPVDAGIVTGTGNYASNATCTLSASPNPGWGFLNWTENGASVSTSGNYTFIVRSNRTLIANFVAAFSVGASPSPSYGGSTAGEGTFDSNSVVTLTASPTPGFAFVSWSEFGTPISFSPSYSFNLTNDRALVANFEPVSRLAIFDFDTGTPALAAGQGIPAAQTQNGLTATFSTLAGGVVRAELILRLDARCVLRQFPLPGHVG